MNFFSKTEVYNSLKNEIMTDNEYKNVKTFWEILQPEKTFRLEQYL